MKLSTWAVQSANTRTGLTIRSKWSRAVRAWVRLFGASRERIRSSYSLRNCSHFTVVCMLFHRGLHVVGAGHQLGGELRLELLRGLQPDVAGAAVLRPAAAVRLVPADVMRGVRL